jgi:MFS family permease
MTTAVRLGIRANAGQFALLVALNALVGAMVGLERSVLPLVGEDEFGLRSTTAILAFVLAFGAAKAITNLAAGALAERSGRKRLLVAGWIVALPVPLLVGLAPSWWWIVAANILLGVNQGLAWSMTVVMKIDLAGPERRGLALGLKESAGYLGVAVTAFLTGALAASYAPRTVVWAGAAIIVAVGLVASLLFVRDTRDHVRLEAGDDEGEDAVPFGAAFGDASFHDPVLRACSQAGLVNNLNDALAWGLAPLYLAAHGASVREIGIVAAVYPFVWGTGQLVTGWLSDATGRKPLITTGMLVQAAALALLVAGDGAFPPWSTPPCSPPSPIGCRRERARRPSVFIASGATSVSSPAPSSPASAPMRPPPRRRSSSSPHSPRSVVSWSRQRPGIHPQSSDRSRPTRKENPVGGLSGDRPRQRGAARAREQALRCRRRCHRSRPRVYGKPRPPQLVHTLSWSMLVGGAIHALLAGGLPTAIRRGIESRTRRSPRPNAHKSECPRRLGQR